MVTRMKYLHQGELIGQIQHIFRVVLIFLTPSQAVENLYLKNFQMFPVFYKRSVYSNEKYGFKEETSILSKNFESNIIEGLVIAMNIFDVSNKSVSKDNLCGVHMNNNIKL